MSIARPTFLGIIPARGGSKGIPNKNKRLFCGKPLLSYAIVEAKKSQYIGRIVVSTESLQIASIAKRYGAEVPFLRPKELAGDKSDVFDAVAHLLKKLEDAEGYIPDYVVLLQPTSPLRTVHDVDETIQLALRRRADAAITICATEPRVFGKRKDDTLYSITKEDFQDYINRQERIAVYKEDGCMVYVNRTVALLKTKSFLGGKLVGRVVPRWRAVDLDEPEDFVVGELLYANLARLQKRIKSFT